MSAAGPSQGACMLSPLRRFAPLPRRGASALGRPGGAHCSPSGAAQRQLPQAWGHTNERRDPRPALRRCRWRWRRIRASGGRLSVHRGTAVGSAPAAPAVQRHSGQRDHPVEPRGGHPCGPRAERHGERPGVGPAWTPAVLRTRHQSRDPHRIGRRDHGDRKRVRGQGAQQSQRHCREARRRYLFHRPDLRPNGVLRRGARAGARLPGRVPRRARRRAHHASRRRLWPTERTLLLSRRAPPVRQRHRAHACPRLRRGGRRHAEQRSHLGRVDRRRRRRAGRYEDRQRGKSLLLRARRYPRARPVWRCPWGHPGSVPRREFHVGRGRPQEPVHHRDGHALPHPRAGARTSVAGRAGKVRIPVANPAVRG